MLSAQQPSSITNSPRSLNQVMQLPKNSISIPNNLLHTYSAPDSPIQPSPRKIINPSSATQGLSPISNSSVLLPLRMRTENNDNQRPDLFNMRSHTDASDSEECLFAPLENNENIKDKGASRNIQTLVDDIKNRKKAQSAKKSYKCSSPISKSVGLWSKENIDASMPVTEKETDNMQKKYRSSVEKVSRSVGGESQFKSEKKEVKATLADLDVDVVIDENLQEEGVEGLFDEGYMDKERLLKELGPIRYSKMSEEDAATIFEIRRKELLSFLKKLGSSSVARKKSHKYPPLIRSSLTSNNGQSSDAEKMEFPSGKALRCLQESIKDNASPTRFIIYNTATESLWNNNNNSQTNKCVTPAKEKKLTLSTRIGCESAPDGKRRDSTKLFKEKEEPNPLIERNLEANFNQLFEWSDITVEKRSPVKMMKQVENNCEDKNDGIESITIDLTKSSRLKKKKNAKKNKEKSEKLSLSQKVVITNMNTGKQWNEDMRLSPFWEQQEIQPEPRVNHKAIEEIRKKNQAVMNDIDEIDDQIQRMQESDNQQLQSLRKPINGREEAQRVIVLEANLQEGYSSAAKVKKSSERSRSLSLKLGFKENVKHNNDISGDKCKARQKSREVIPEEPGSQSSRKNDRVKFAENVEEVRRANAPTPIKLSTEKIVTSTQSQPNTLKFSLNKPVHNKSSERQTPVSKQALLKNNNGSRSALKEMNSNLHVTTNANAIAEMNEFRAIELEIARESSALKQAFNTNVKPAQSAVNKTLETNKINNRPSSLNIRNDLLSPPQKANRISKTTETTSTLQTVREHLLTSPKETVFTLRRTSSKVKSEVFCKREPSSGSIPSAKKITNTPKLPNKSVSIKVNQKAASDKYITEATPIPNLFESNSETNRREPSPAPKISALSQEKTPVVSAVKQQSAVKRTETPKTVKNTPIQAKKGEANRPNFDTNSSAGIRAKIFRRNQESSALIKPILSPKSLSSTGTSRFDSDQMSCGVSPSISRTETLPFKSSGSIQETLRKGSLSTPRGFKLLSSSNIQGGAVAQSLQDLREKLSGKQGVETPEMIESLESFRLREKSLNLPLRPGKSLSQAENTVTQIKKDSQTFKRKQTTGYSLSSLNQKL